MADENNTHILKGEPCPSCGQKTLNLVEYDTEIPYFGKAFIYSMDCDHEGCGYHLADVELEKNEGPTKVEIDVSLEEDMKIRVVKSSAATIKIPRIMSIEPGPVSNGYITNVEGVLSRVKRMLEKERDDDDVEKENYKKLKNMIKKIQDVMWGQDTLKIIIEDPTGNSAIISDKAKVSKLPASAGKKKDD
jgi:zinc finger protein